MRDHVILVFRGFDPEDRSPIGILPDGADFDAIRAVLGNAGEVSFESIPILSDFKITRGPWSSWSSFTITWTGVVVEDDHSELQQVFVEGIPKPIIPREAKDMFLIQASSRSTATALNLISARVFVSGSDSSVVRAKCDEVKERWIRDPRSAVVEALRSAKADVPQGAFRALAMRPENRDLLPDLERAGLWIP